MAEKVIRTLRDFPAVETLLQFDELASALARVPRPVAAEIIKAVVAAQKELLRSGKSAVSHDSLMRAVREALADEASCRLNRVINATGIVVHTNLGRAPLSGELLRRIETTVGGYGNVEFDLGSGKRGGRGAATERYLASLSEAEAGTVVNNNAAALFLILNTLANRKNVIISRGELVQIGGGFRIPDILRKSGARLCEVGTTNITTLSDYEKALDDKTGLILKVHKSNFVQAGFTEEADLKPLVALGDKRGVPVVNDLGSGVFVSTRELLGYHEPTVQESVRAGAALTCFSGDKMLGGVQSGLIVGRAGLVAQIKKNPLYRTMRVDKIVFAVLERLLAAYLDGRHMQDIRLWQLLARPIEELRAMAEQVIEKAGRPTGAAVEATEAFVGGGAMPEHRLKSIGIAFESVHRAERLMSALRNWTPPIIGRIDNDRFILDFKAVDPEDVTPIARAVKLALK